MPRVIIWVNVILNHVDTRMILLRYEGFCMVYIDPNDIKNKNTVKYAYPIGIKKV